MNLQPQDPIDTLRDDLAKRFGSHLLADPPKRGVTGNSMADEVMRFLASAANDPVRLRAILELVGLEVREGKMVTVEDDMGGFFKKWIAYPYLNDPNAYSSRCVIEDVLVCRVRPQGEQANA